MEKGDVKKASSLMMCAVFMGFLLFFAVGYIAIPYQGVNYTEQRYYSSKPEFTLDSFMNGEFREGLENYLIDHLAGRTFFVTLCSELKNFTGRRGTSFYWRGNDGQMFRKSVYYENELKATADAINKFAEKTDVPIDMILTPDAAGILDDKLPIGVVNDSEDMIAEAFRQQLDSKINLYYTKDVIEKAAAEGIKVFYRTDQHWTTECARRVFESYMQQSGQGLRAVEYEEHYSSEFYGNLYPCAPSFFDEPETVLYYTNPLGKYTVTRLDTGKTTDTIYDYSFLVTLSNKYIMPLSGDFWRVRITSDAPGKKLLLLGDSYMLPMIQLLADQYKEILVIDARDFDKRGKSMEEAIGDFRPDRILFVDTVFQISCGAISQISR